MTPWTTAVSPTPTTSPTPTPTPTPSTTTAVTPTAATTGVPSGTTLATMSGGYIRTAGATIANKVISGDATFVGDDLTLRNVRVTGTAIFRGDRVTLQDSEFGAVVLSGTAGATVTRVDVFGVRGKDGIEITAGSGAVTGVVIRDSWVHNPVIASGTGYAGVEVRGVDGLTLDNVLVDLGSYKPELQAAVRLETDNGGSKNVTINHARLLGGEYTLTSYGTTVRVTDSVLGNPFTGYLKPGSKALTAFTGNTTPAGARLVYSGTAIS